MTAASLADELEDLLKAVEGIPAKPAGKKSHRAIDSAATPDETAEEIGDPDDAPLKLWLQGADGVPVPADWHPHSRRLRVRYEDYGEFDSPAAQGTVKKALGGIPVGELGRDALRGVQALWRPFLKNVDTTGTTSGSQHLSAEEMKALHLTWITAHPNGPGTDPAVPLIVHDNGDHYVVVGGAHGQLNQMVLPKSGEKKELKKQASAKSSRQQEEFKKNDPEAFTKLRDAAKIYKTKAKEALSAHVENALSQLGGSMDEIKAAARDQALKEAKENDPNATPEELEKFAGQAEKAAEAQAKGAVESALQTALDSVAKAQINQEAVQAQDVEVVVGGKKLVKTLSPEELQSMITSAATVDKLKQAAAAVKKALATGKADLLPGLDALISETAPSESEVDQWLQSGFLQREAVKRQAALVIESQLASPSTQRKHQALGASDSLNSLSAVVTGSSCLDPGTVQYLGVEASARVLAAHLAAKGHDPAKLAEQLAGRMRERSDLHVAAVLRLSSEMDALSQAAEDAAAKGDGMVTWSQALILRENQAARKFALLNVCRGQLQAASSLYWHLTHPSKKPLTLSGGESEVATRIKAKSLGLEDGDYELQGTDDKKGFQLVVKPETIGKLAQPASPAQGERTRRVAEIKQEAEQGGAGSWQPSEGWQDGMGEPGPDGKKYRVDLAPHQIAAARTIVQEGKVLLSHSAGSGKTAAYYAAGAELLATGKCKRGIMTMPAKPRSQQEDYQETQSDGSKKPKTGEKTKFLQGEMADRFLVVKSGAHLQKLLAENPDRCLIMSPELMRDQAGLLQQHGFGGPDTFYFADEAHELSAGTKDQEGSGKANAAESLARSCGYVALGTGTAIENDGSELHSLLSYLDQAAFPDSGKKAFAERWERQAMQGREAALAGEQLGALQNEVGGYMLHYHQDPTGPDGKPVSLTSSEQVISLGDDQKAKIVAANEQRAKDEVDPDPDVRAAAALRWNGSVMRACIGPPMFDHISDYVGERRKQDPGYKAVVWSQELLPIGELESRLGKHGKVVTITGANGDKETKAAIDQFQNDPDVVAVVISNAANFGVNLQAGQSVLKCGFPPVPSKSDQLDARIFRRGQDKDCETLTFMGDHPLVRAAYANMKKVKGSQMALLASLADDSLLGQLESSDALPVGKSVAEAKTALSMLPKMDGDSSRVRMPFPVEFPRLAFKKIGKKGVGKVKLSDLKAIEPGVYPGKVKQYIEKGPGTKPSDLPTVAVVNGEYYLQDGNHRAVAAHLLGESEIDVNLVHYENQDADDNPKDDGMKGKVAKALAALLENLL